MLCVFSYSKGGLLSLGVSFLLAVAAGNLAADSLPVVGELRKAAKLRLTYFEEGPARQNETTGQQDLREPTSPPGGTAPSRAVPSETVPSKEVELTPAWKREELSVPGPLRGVYDKPFLVSMWRQVFLGGYFETEYHNFEDQVRSISEGFRLHRLNLFAYSDISDTIRFGSEIEFENEDPEEDDTEVKVEMAFLDWVIYEELIFRGGAILVPLGRVNVNHDGPVRELTDRPMVDTFVIPTTLTDTGVGFLGAFQAGATLSLGYETYLVNGFQVLSDTGVLAAPISERENLLREGSPSTGGDSNSDVASTGRLFLRVEDLLELGGSWNVGTYDEKGDNLLTILAGDVAVVYESFALEGEVAGAFFERDSFAKTAGVPQQFWGFYAQGAANFMPDFLRSGVPNLFAREGATFTAVLRYDYVDLAGDIGESIEPGINFRPFADTVFKFSYRFSLESLGLQGGPGRRGNDDEGFVFSIATYF